MPKNLRNKFAEIVAANPDIRWDEAAFEAGYSRKRAKITASLMRRDPRVQARIQALTREKLQTPPDLATYHETLARTKQAALAKNDAYVLLQCTLLEAREVLPQAQPEKGKQPSAVLAKFVGTPEQAETLNASAAEFEEREQLPPGFLGRVEAEADTEVTPPEPPLRANERKEVCSHHGEFVSK